MSIEEPKKKYLVMPNGDEIQIAPIMTEEEFSASKAKNHYSYENYLKVAPRAVKELDEMNKLRVATGLEPHTLTRQEFSGLVEHTSEAFDIWEMRRRSKRKEKKE